VCVCVCVCVCVVRSKPLPVPVYSAPHTHTHTHTHTPNQDLQTQLHLPRFCSGTWDVLTLLKSDKIQELAEQVVNTKLERAAKQETRWSENGLIKINNYSF